MHSKGSSLRVVHSSVTKYMSEAIRKYPSNLYMAGVDTTSVGVLVSDYEVALTRSIKGMKIGIPKEYRVKGMPDEIEALWWKGVDWLEAEVVEVSLPHGDREHGRPARHLSAGRPRRARPATGLAVDRPSVRRGDAVLGRRGD